MSNKASTRQPITADGLAQGEPFSWGKKLRQRKRSMLLSIARFFLRQALRAQMLAVRIYEPVMIKGTRYEGRRGTEERWEAISSILKAYSARNVLDLGCAEGWFLRRAATELGCFAVGVEASARLLAGEIARLHDETERTSIMLTRATADDIRKLPKFDVVICLSVAHHIFRRQGTAAAEDFIRALADRAGKAVVFEMGTSEEKDLVWADVLPDMPEGQEVYVRRLLEKCGLKNVRRIASTPAFHGQAARILFSGEPAPT